MAGRPRTKMSIENRAKQFMPFAALKGLPDALAAKEKIVVEKIELSSDMEEELDRKMHVGGDIGSFAAEAELNMFAHGVVDNAVTCSDRNAARNGCESGGQLFRNIVGGSDCVEARCRVCCTSAKNVFTGRSGLKRN